MFQTNLRETDATMDVDATLDAIERHGADTWLVNAGGILSFYPTDLPHQTRNPHLEGRPSGDLLGDAVTAAHERGIRVVARMDFSKIGPEVAARHPEWLYVDPQGEHQVFEGLASTCPSAGYYQEAAFEALTEVATRYPVDGFFFNWFGFNEVDYAGRYRGVSQNDASRRAFSAYAPGTEMPTDWTSPTYGTWLAYASATIEDLTRRFREHISSLRPEACFIRGDGADVYFHEANNELGRTLWPSATSENVSAARTAHPERPVFSNSVAFYDMPYRLAAEQPAHYRQYIAQTLARGGTPSVYIMGEPGAIDYPNVDAVSPLFHLHRQHTEDYDGLVPAADVLLVRPDVPQRGQEGPDPLEYRGIHLALQQSHIPFDVLRARDLGAADANDLLERYDVVVLPDLGPLEDRTVTVLDRWVSTGGAVVTTGRSAVRSDGSPQLASYPARLLGPPLAAPETFATYAVRPAPAGSAPRAPVVPLVGTWSPMDVHADATTVMSLVPPAPFGPPEKAHGNLVGSSAAVARSRPEGGGSVTVLPWTAGRGFLETGLSVIGDAVALAVDAGRRGRVPLGFSLPRHVEVTVQRGRTGTLVHLVNLGGILGNNFVDTVPVTGGAIRVGRPVRAHDLRTDRLLPMERDADGGLEIRVPDIDTLSVIRIEGLDAPPEEESHAD
ncbi:beta-galactosidase [Phycicoccus sp. BSK3Z-2]|uniref:Beta-galactosidase n=1 Tax=Phycicoccus avicenniae TaxID=2828860 RepID=A0A941DAP2_9MICO|nr:alpha-amylase family protein [Phycicoccus avicenniae]MBR7744805.1 beta-galactosidase [Phycicoccus avicenniae]